MYRIEKYITISFTSIAICACFFMTFFSTPLIEDYKRVQFLCLAIVAVYLLVNSEYLIDLFRNKFGKLLFLVYFSASFLAAYLNLRQAVQRIPLNTTALYFAVLIEDYLLFRVICNRKLVIKLIDNFLAVSASIMLIVDMMYIIMRRYIMENKFSVAYLHLIVILFFVLKYDVQTLKGRFFFVLLIAETLLIDLRTGCVTGVVGTIMMVTFMLLYEKKIYFSSNPVIVFVSIVVTALFPYWYTYILNSEIARVIVEDVLHKKMTLTGRTVIYSNIPALLGDYYLIGYGLGTNHEISMRYGASNIQNGLLRVIMESGLIGAIALALIIVVAFVRNIKNKDSRVQAFSAYILTFIWLSTVEVTYSLSVIVITVLFAVLSNEKVGISKNSENIRMLNK